MSDFETFIRDLKQRLDACVDHVDMVIALRWAVDEAHERIVERLRLDNAP